jgi:hypothetical protein
MDLVFYTYFYGNNKNPAYKIPKLPSTNYKCYFYTNNKTMLKKLKTTKWIAIYDNKPVSNDYNTSNMQGKYIKSLPHEFKELHTHDYVCYLDTKLPHVNIDIVINLIDTYFVKQNYAMLLRKHWFINNKVWDEYEESIKQARYKLESEKYKQYIATQFAQGLSDTIENHAACGFIIRNMKHKNINDINSTWYSHIQQCGVQDQISFFFVQQLFPDYIKTFTEVPYH